MRQAYPVYDQSYQAHLTTVRRYVAGITNLQLIGRNGQHRYNNQDHSMLTGVYAARNLAGANYDVWSVNVEQEYHEDGAAAVVPAERAAPTFVPPQPAPGTMSPEQFVEAAFARLDPVALGAACGVVAGLGLFLATAGLVLQGGVTVGTTLALLSGIWSATRSRGREPWWASHNPASVGSASGTSSLPCAIGASGRTRHGCAAAPRRTPPVTCSTRYSRVRNRRDSR